MLKGFSGIAILAVIGAVLGIALYSGAFFSGELITVNGVSGEFVRPLFGYYKCDPMPRVDKQLAASFRPEWDGQIYIRPYNAYIENWDLYVSCDGDKTFGYQFFYQTTNPADGCFIANSDNKWCSAGITSSGQTYVGQFDGDTEVRIGRCAISPLLAYSTTGKAYYSYTPYGLWKYEPTSPANIVNAGGCTLESARNIITSCNDMKNKGEGSKCLYEATINAINKGLGFRQTVSYVVGNFMASVEAVREYNGQNVACIASGNGYDLYSIGSVQAKTAYGEKTYFMPKDYVTHKLCCMGVNTLPGYYCDNWELKPVQPDNPPEVECNANYECANAGQAYSDPNNPNQWLQEKCINNKCVAVSAGQKECSYTNPCPVGYTCNPNTFKCEQNVVIPQCGDGICQFGEDEQSCPSDCKPGTSFIGRIINLLSSFAIYLIVSAILVAVLVIVSRIIFPIPFISGITGNYKMLALVWIGLALFLWLFLAVPVAGFYQASIAPLIT